MKEIDDKFDKYEKVVERVSKLILKIVTTLAALTVGIVFAWNQMHDTLDERHVHYEDEEFQEYLMEMETSAGYEGEVPVDTVFIDTVVIDTTPVDNMDMPDLVDTMVVDTVVIDTLN
jgi:hypothetical protein